MELIILAVLIMAATYLGYKMGKGDSLSLPVLKMKKAIRSEADEAELEKKLKNEYRPVRR